MTNELALFEGDTLDRMTKASGMLAKSGIVPSHLRNKQADVFSILCMGAELGLAPMSAIRSIYVVQGRPTLSAQLMLGMVRAKYQYALIDIKLDEENLIATCTTARDFNQKEYAYTATWDMEKAARMGLVGRDQYKKQAMTMLKWRAVAEACRTTFPDVLMGLHATEEFKDFDGKDTITDLDAELEKDFPIPEEEKVLGPLYRHQHGKFTGHQNKDIDREEMEPYLALQIKKQGEGKAQSWANDLITAMGDYLENYDVYRDIVAELEEA